MTASIGTNGSRLPAAIILIPAFNEGEVIAEVIAEIGRYSVLPVIVIDDASTDNTIAKARQAGATVIPLPAQLAPGVPLKPACAMLSVMATN